MPLLHRSAALFLVIFVFSACGAAANEPASIVESLLELRDPLRSGWALSDFDGDRKTDLAVSREVARIGDGYLYRLELKLSRTQQVRSFTFSSTDTLGVNIAAVDVDGDHDLDFVIDGRFTRIGVWINDGRGRFTQDLRSRYSAPEDRVLHPLRLEVPAQPVNQNALQRMHGCLPSVRFVPVASFCNRAESGIAVGCKSRFRNGSLRLRGPPTPSFNLRSDSGCVAGRFEVSLTKRIHTFNGLAS